MNKIVILLFGILASPCISHAQEVAVNTEIVTIALDESVSGLFFNNGKGISLFQANPTGLGEPLKYKGSAKFLVRNSEAEFTMKPPLPAPYAAVDLPLNADRVLLACLKTGEAPMRIIAYDIGRGRIGAGDYRFFNFSSSIVSVIFGEKKFAVKPGEENLVSDASWKKEVMEIDMEMAIAKNDKIKPVYSSQWGHRPGRRNYIFIFNGPQEYNPVKICRFFDVPPSVPEKSAP